MYDYNDRDDVTIYNQTLDKINLLCTVAFIIEAMIKIIARGLICHRNSYLRGGWNIIDAMVVISGYFSSLIFIVSSNSVLPRRILSRFEQLECFAP